MSNKTNTKSGADVLLENPTYELLFALNELTLKMSSTVRQFATCILSAFFVVGLLLIVPAMMQTAAAYVWAAQVRKEAKWKLKPSQGIGDPKRKSLTEEEELQRRCSTQDRTLFLYRLLACSASLLVLIFSTLPQLVIVVAKPPGSNSIDQKWGWCQALVYADSATRCFASYFIVVPFLLMFWNYMFSEIIPRQNLLTDNIFMVILKSSLPIALFSFFAPIALIVHQYVKAEYNGELVCQADLDWYIAFFYYDFVVTRVIPAFIIIVIGAGFLKWLPRDDYGVFYEPGIFLAFATPHIICELVIHIYHRGHWLRYLVQSNFCDFMLIFYAVYHMSFSSTFVLATFRSVFSEIREEIRRRQRFFMDDEPTEINQQQEDGTSHGKKRRARMIHGLQKQFSVAYRWKPDFTEEETRTVSANPASVIPDTATDSSQSDEDQDGIGAQNRSRKKGNKNEVDDAQLHYAILQRSAFLKRQSKPMTSLQPKVQIPNQYVIPASHDVKARLMHGYSGDEN
ncbi:unnamed protein product [Calicophoron daubneyi]|uniref:Uncharacterized protein n=1 Tax=Calicophoron daubneyi TaxID=300641 RepID=A0AAV2TIR0_CALDB